MMIFQNVVAYFKSDRLLYEVFHDVFGYSTRVDPLRHVGECVKKSDYNAKHDGQVINCPIEKIEPDCIYQLKLNNEIPGTNYVLDLRTYVFGDMIPFVRLTFKPKETRFGANFDDSEMMATHKMYSSGEVVQILKLCRRMGLNYGEVDIIRHLDDGNIYILDVNSTPSIWTINPCYDFDDRLNAARAFYNAFLQRPKHLDGTNSHPVNPFFAINYLATSIHSRGFACCFMDACYLTNVLPSCRHFYRNL